MKTDYLSYLCLLTITNNNLFAFSFLQGTQSHNALTSQRAKSLRSVQSTCTTNSLSRSSIYRSSVATATCTTTTRLYGFLDRFRNNNHEDENDDDGEDELEQREYSELELENARKAFEEMFSIPNDNQKKKKKKHKNKNSQPSTSFGIIENENSNTENVDLNIHSSNSGNKDKQREIITKTRDITKIGNSIPQPPLTAISRERRLKEITLLSTLTQSDDAVNELWGLWIAEKGPAAATLLLRAEQLMSVESYDDAESILWSLVHEHGVHWAEPVNRLATLKYMQGRLEESKKLCETVLQVKPWHFGALSGIVLVCTAMNDATGARMWAERRLPPLIPEHTSGDRRNKWISRAVEDATESLDFASKVGRNSKIGKEEIEFRAFRARMQHLHMEEGGSTNISSSASSTENNPSPSEDLDAWQ